MMRPERTWHLRMWMVIAAALAVGLVAALSVRSPHHPQRTVEAAP